jgi:hypothetical protein
MVRLFSRALLGGIVSGAIGVGACAGNSSSNGVDGEVAGTDGGGVVDDANADSKPVVAGAHPSRIANLASTPGAIDVCYSNSDWVPGATPPKYVKPPLLKSFGLPGVPPGAMSAPFPPPADSYARGVLFHVIDAAVGDCTTNLIPGQEEYLFLGDDSIFAYRGDSSQVDQGKVAAPTPGKDFVVAIQADTWAERTVTFLPPGRVEVPIYGFPSGAVLDATGSGTIVTQGKLGATSPTPDVSRPFKPKAGGSAVLLVSANKTIVCDLDAPPVGGFTVCGDTARAP